MRTTYSVGMFDAQDVLARYPASAGAAGAAGASDTEGNEVEYVGPLLLRSGTYPNNWNNYEVLDRFF